MAKLQQITYHRDICVEEAELTEEQVKLFKENEEEFFKKYDLDWDYVDEWQKYDYSEYELIEDEEE